LASLESVHWIPLLIRRKKTIWFFILRKKLFFVVVKNLKRKEKNKLKKTNHKDLEGYVKTTFTGLEKEKSILTGLRPKNKWHKSNSKIFQLPNPYYSKD
jgi:hypothetical protein